MNEPLENFENYVEELFKSLHKTYKGLHQISHHNDMPIDSFDRLYALYLIDKKPHIINKVYKFESRETCQCFLDNLDDHTKKEMKSLSPYSYENYEREGMSDVVAYGNLLFEATKGKWHVYVSEYGNGGWFGSS